MTASSLKQQVLDAVAAHAATIVDVSRSIHANPELMFEEQHAHALLTEVLEVGGMAGRAPGQGHRHGVRGGAGGGERSPRRHLL